MTSSSGNALDALLAALAEDTWENLREAKIRLVRIGEEITHPRLPDGLGVLPAEGQRKENTQLPGILLGAIDESPWAAAFKQLGIGVHSRQMNCESESSPSFIITKRANGIDLSQRPPSRALLERKVHP